MDLPLAERAHYAVRWLMRQKKKTQAEIASELGYTNPTVLSQILTGKKPFPNSLPERIASLDESLNIDFLRGNSEDMLVNGPRQPITPAPPSPRNTTQAPKVTKSQGIFIPAELATMFSDMAATIRMQQETIQSLTNQNK